MCRLFGTAYAFSPAMKVLVTGGAGFIGANLVRALFDGPDNDVVVIDDLSFGFRDRKSVV